MSQSPEVVKWYTHARRFPQLIGKLPDGGHIWGGPYTFTQVGVGVAVLAGGAKTIGWWGGQFGPIGSVAVLLGVFAVAVWSTGRLPVGSRNPLSMLLGAWAAFRAPAAGKFAGRKVAIGRPHLASGGTLVGSPVPLPDAQVEPAAVAVASFAAADPQRRWSARRWSRAEKTAPAAAASPDPHTLAATSGPVLSQVQQLLAGHGLHQEN